MNEFKSNGSFNTGRGYSAEGQIINWSVLNTEVDDTGAWFDIEFDDTSRGIKGYVLVNSHAFYPSPAALEVSILEKYDAGQYKLSYEAQS
jgi:hypothetical protein